jgi:hypothetical protein
LPTAVLFPDKGLPTRVCHERISNTLLQYYTLLAPLGDRMTYRLSGTKVKSMTEEKVTTKVHRDFLNYL